MRQAVILVGGQGSRLGELTEGRPKPFVDVNGEPFINRLLHQLQSIGIREVLLLGGVNAAWVDDHFVNPCPSLRIDLHVEQTPQGTGGCLRQVADRLDARFLLMNGDSILASNLASLFPELDGHVAVAMALRNVADAGRYGRVQIENGWVQRFDEKTESGQGIVNAGIYACERDLLIPRIPGPASLENDILPRLVEDGLVKGIRYDGYFLDIGLPDTLRRAREELDRCLRQPAVIFDRDNTLVEDHGYTWKVEDLKWLPGAVDAIRKINDGDRRVFVATNQAGIAKGHYRQDDMHRFHAAMQAALHEAGAHIDGFFFCPHHPEGVVPHLAVPCDCRKPGTGMLQQMSTAFDLDLAGSVIVGDKLTDVECGLAFGIRGLRFDGGNLLEFLERERVM
ncbi:HAD-IIIA family hydrolase [Pseudokordiimonas caeni]|uniref:HAD-IIIA family hydrolase n=1 Tax=Pseudokordiimonas caeni TaxID=2997908 RepID=UPI002811AE5E|nr:HAD-IIIA family hydrolase [Pseudokordiimonas caeni]